MTNSNIIIKNNIVGQGGYLNGVTLLPYNYDNCGWILGSSIIESNYFSGVNTSSDMLKITDASCMIRDNKFIRNTTTIASYIKYNYVMTSYNEVQDITDNIFDKTTIDGYTEQLVFGLNPGSIYTRNRNQIGYVYIPLFSNIIGSFDTSSPLYNGLETFNFNSSSSVEIRRAKEVSNHSNLIVQINPSNDATGYFLGLKRSFDAQNYLENGVLIISARLGATLPGSNPSTIITDFTNCYFGVNIKSHNAARSMDPFNNFHEIPLGTFSSKKFITSFSDVSALTSSTVYTLIGFGSVSASEGNYYGFINPDAFRVGNGYQIEIEFQTSLNFEESYDALLISPIEIKYQW